MIRAASGGLELAPEPLHDEELRRERDELVWDWRCGVRSRAGRPPRRPAEVAVIFNITHRYVNVILRRVEARRAAELGGAAS